MNNSLLKRIKALEDKAPSDLIVCAITDNGEEVEVKVKDIITETGELKEGYSGIGCSGGMVKSGNNLKDLERILKYVRVKAENACVHNTDMPL